MKNTILSIFISIFLLSAANAKDFTIIYENAEQHPWQMGKGSTVPDDKPGTYVEAVKLMGERLGLTIHLKRAPWKRCLSELEAGSVDGLFYASFKEKRLKMGAYPYKDGKLDTSRRLDNFSYVLYRLKGGTVSVEGGKVVNADGKIGATRGYSIVDDLKAYNIKVDESDSIDLDFGKMVKGRIIGAVGIDVVGDNELAKNADFAAKIEKYSVPLKTKDSYFMISNQFKEANPELAEKIWDELSKIRDNDIPNFTKKY